MKICLTLRMFACRLIYGFRRRCRRQEWSDMRRLLLSAAFAVIALTASAQKWSVGTNVIEWASLGTCNIEGSYAVARHWTVDVDWAYNPWTYKEGRERQFQNRSLSGEAGVRWWPWHAYSGWWVSGCGRYEVYNRGGIFDGSAEEGDAYGVGAGFGYALMLSERINLDFGIGLWTGRKDYTVYRCTSCGRIVDGGSRWFVMPNDVMVSFVYVF